MNSRIYLPLYATGDSLVSGPAFLYLCMLLSSISSLVYEVCWSRMLIHVFGTALPAVSTIFAVFMGGLAIGAYFAGSYIQRKYQHGTNVSPKVLEPFAALVLFTGLSGMLLPVTFSHASLQILYSVLKEQPLFNSYLFDFSRFTFMCVLLIIPCISMGATFPLLSLGLYDNTLRNNNTHLNQNISYLYAISTVGGLIGTLAAGFFLLPSLGLFGSCLVASGINFILSLIVLLVSKHRKFLPAQDSLQMSARAYNISQNSSINPNSSDTVLSRLVMVTALVAGLLAMSLEVTWTRLFSLVLGSSTYSVSLVLAIVLAGMSIGSFLAVKVSFHLSRPFSVIAYIYFLSALVLLASLYLANLSPWLFLTLEKLVFTYLPSATTFSLVLICRIIVIASITLIPSILMGTVFPLLLCTISLEHHSVSFKVGQLFAANTIGCILGSCITGFLLIPKFSELFLSGMQSTLLLIACCQLVLAVFVFVYSLRTSVLYKLYLAPLVSSIAIFIVIANKPAWDPALMSSGISFFNSFGNTQAIQKALLPKDIPQLSSDILYYREGPNTTVTVGLQSEHNIVYLKTDGKTEAALPHNLLRATTGSDMKTQVLLAILPMLVHRGNLGQAFLIGYGSGTTAGSLLNSPEMKSIEIAELEPSVLAASKFFRQVNNHALLQERIKTGEAKIIVNDARYWLTVGSNKFDIIVSQPTEPWVNGSSELFTTEFWKLSRARLAINGIFCQWLQLYGIAPRDLAMLVSTFQQAFPETLVFHPAGAGEIILLGVNGSACINWQNFVKRFAQKSVRKDLMRVGIYAPEELLGMLIQGPKALKSFCQEFGLPNSAINTDDNLKAEFALAKTVSFGSATITTNLKNLFKHSTIDLNCFCNYGNTTSEQAEFASKLAFSYGSQLPFAYKEFANSLNPCKQAILRLSQQATRSLPVPQTVFRLSCLESLLNAKNLHLEEFNFDKLSFDKLTPESYADYLSLGDRAFYAGQLKQAEYYYQKALIRAPQSAKPHERIGWLALAKNNCRLAFQEFTKAYQLDSSAILPLLGQGYALVKLRQPLPAAQVFCKLLALDHTNYEARFALAILLLKLDKEDEGFQHLKDLRQQNPYDSAISLYTIAYYAQRCDWQKALAYFNSVSNTIGYDSRLQLLAYVIFQHLNYPNKAEEALHKYMQLTAEFDKDKVLRQLHQRYIGILAQITQLAFDPDPKRLLKYRIFESRTGH